MNETLRLFRSLTSVPTAPYYEAAVTRRALRWIRERLGAGVSVRRRRGGVIVRYTGQPGAPALAFAAHMDHPAFHLSRVTARAATATMQGGLDAAKLDGFPVEAFPALPSGNEPRGVGTLRLKGPGKPFEVRWLQRPRGPVAFATLALTPFSVAGGWLASRSIDDLLGCAVSLEAMRRLVARRAKTNVAVLLHRAEEVGFIGALDLIDAGAVPREDTILSIECSREMPGARPGRGAVIRLGDKATVFDPNATALLDEAAALRRRPIQRLRLTGGTCEATAYLGSGYEAGGVAIPLVNYHNGLRDKAIAPERVRLSDIECAVGLLVDAALLFPKKALRGTLRRRLAALHKSRKFGRITS
jgi:putative aminopeptidase FrvX